MSVQRPASKYYVQRPASSVQRQGALEEQSRTMFSLSKLNKDELTYL